jgi:hypothetical protein
MIHIVSLSRFSLHGTNSGCNLVIVTQACASDVYTFGMNTFMVGDLIDKLLFHMILAISKPFKLHVEMAWAQ